MRRINKCRTSDVRLPDILVAGKKDFEASPRPRFQLHRHARRDAVIVTHASFEKISVSLKNRQKFIQSQIREIEQAIIEQKREERGSRLAKELIALPLSYVGKKPTCCETSRRVGRCRAGNQEATVLKPTQGCRIKAAIPIAKKEHSDVVIDGRDGKIRDRDSCRSDPSAPAKKQEALSRNPGLAKAIDHGETFHSSRDRGDPHFDYIVRLSDPASGAM
ncbi:MAG: DUF2188 domain-containing protein [Candidatus Binatia bacterium]